MRSLEFIQITDDNKNYKDLQLFFRSKWSDSREIYGMFDRYESEVGRVNTNSDIKNAYEHSFYIKVHNV